MDTVVPLNVIVDNIVEMNDLFTDVAAGEGLAPLMLVAGVLLMFFSIAVFGVLSLGALGSLFTFD